MTYFDLISFEGIGEMFGQKKEKKTVKGLSYDTQIELVFPAGIFLDPVLEAILERVGIVMESKGNKIMLFTDARTVAALNADENIKKIMQTSGVGTVLCGWNQQNRTSFLINELQKIVGEYASNGDAMRLAIFDLHRFARNGMLGQIDPNPFAAPFSSVDVPEKFDLASAINFMLSPEQLNKPKMPSHRHAAEKFGKR